MRAAAISTLLLALLAPIPFAHASDRELELMREPIPYTDVIDAFDGNDLYDLNVHLDYVRTNDRGRIQREQTSASGKRERVDIADSERTTSTLSFGLDVGLYHDVMAFVRLPLTLGDARALDLPDGSNPMAVQTRLTDPNDFGGAESPLFGVPFRSPTRAGFDYVAFGGAWALFNQQRTPHAPTWLLMLEGRRAVGETFQPCRDAGDATYCGSVNAQDIDADGVSDGTAERFGQGEPGSSRGLSGLLFETRLSRRFRSVEPYTGLSVLMQWPATANKFYNPGGDLAGAGHARPSQQGSATFGAAYIPWEHRGRYQRFALDLRLLGTYLSPGREYSALYDALGTSAHAELSRPNFEGVRNVDDPNAVALTLPSCESVKDPSAPCRVGRKVPFYGLTDVAARVRYGFRFGLELQAARYVRFAFGTALSWVTSHAITLADACVPSVQDSTRATGYRGASCATGAPARGIVNPSYRQTIDAPGRRFWMTGELIVDFYATATAQF